jgi:hypothetical protein
MELATFENTVFVLLPIKRIVPTTITRILRAVTLVTRKSSAAVSISTMTLCCFLLALLKKFNLTSQLLCSPQVRQESQ